MDYSLHSEWFCFLVIGSVNDGGDAAGVAYEANKPLSFEDIHVSPPQPTEVRVKITHACICQSDLYFWKGKVLSMYKKKQKK